MKKYKIVAFMLALTMLITLTSCGTSASHPDSSVPSDTVTSTDGISQNHSDLPTNPIILSPEPAESPTLSSTAAPTLEPTTEPTLEPATEPTVEPTEKATPEPVTTPKPVPSEVLGAKETAEPITSPADQIPEISTVEPEPSGFIGDGITGIDPDDPYYGIPGYEGPREGYEYSFMMGYYKPEEAKQTYEDAYQNASYDSYYWDWEGHAKAAQEGYDGNYGEWVKLNMDWVNAYCASNGFTYEEYCYGNGISP